MSSRVFLDTSGLIALLNRDDDYHQQAVQVFEGLGLRSVEVTTTNLVLGELGNGLARTGLRQEVGWLIEQLHSDPAATVIHVDRGTFLQGVCLYRDRRDKHWGLIDCISFAVMSRLGISDAFSTDAHFVQAGFHCLLTLPRRT